MNEIKEFINVTLQEMADEVYQTFKLLGHAIEGHNGPYGHSDTPVRNTCHWLIIYGYLWKKKHNKKYYDIMCLFADYICDIQQQSESGAIECMTTDLFDHLNGLIGQAWAIEALVFAYKIANDERYIKTALAIYHAQQYDWNNHLWERIELDGSNIGYDYTLNHQMYFAAAASMISDCHRDEEIEIKVKDFLDGLMTHFNVHPDGLICHYVALPRPQGKKHPIRKLVKTVGQPLKFIDPNGFNLSNHEIGYHLYDMYVFALLYPKYKDAAIFLTEKFKKAFAYAMDVDGLNERFNRFNFERLKKSFLARYVKLNKFSYGYNSPTFELPVIGLAFNSLDKIDVADLWEFQYSWFYDETSKNFGRNNHDGKILTCRIYEIIPYLMQE